ncbi:MFS general substrate transporter [Pyrenochaeta sp. DS3sAY3a]|nr:MFS general substrate transporter [Pyrenochaeta sp. DS3sAY3a]
MEDEPQPIPWKFKWVALACVISLPLGRRWASSTLGPLKNTLRNELGINNAQYGVMSSADGLVNTLLPIFGGMLLDWWGPNSVTLVCTTVMLGGNALAAGATNLGKWRVLVAGQIIEGLGVAVLDSAQHKFFYHWFGARDLGFAFGIDNAVAKAVGIAAGMAAVPIRDGTGHYQWSFWIAVIFCAVSWLINIGYVWFANTIVPPQHRLTSARANAMAKNPNVKTKVVDWRVLFTIPWAYMMFPLTQTLQAGGAGGFQNSAADIIRMKGFKEDVAGYMSTGQMILPIVLSPIIGICMDRYGHRFHLVALAPIFFITCCALIGFTDLHPLVALVFGSLGDSFNALPIQIIIPLLVADQSKLGTAFGLWRAYNNSNTTITDVVYGVLQDGTENMGYTKVLLFAIGIKSWGFVLGVLYIILDFKKLGKGMTMTRHQREARLKAITDPANDPLTRRVPNKYITIAALTMLVALIVVAWVMFFKYLM